MKKFKGRDALLRVHNPKPRSDAEDRVPTQATAVVEHNFFTASVGVELEGKGVR